MSAGRGLAGESAKLGFACTGDVAAHAFLRVDPRGRDRPGVAKATLPRQMIL